jgi:hypothetical protein
MIPEKKLGIFSSAKDKPFYILDDCIFTPVYDPTPRSSRLVCMGHLTAWVDLLVNSLLGSNQVSNTVKELQKKARNIFFFCDLIPYIRSLDGEANAEFTPERAISSELSDLLQRARRLPTKTQHQLAASVRKDLIEEVQRILTVPCAVAIGHVFPLEQKGFAADFSDVTIGPKTYRHCVELARPFGAVLEQVEEAIVERSSMGEQGGIDEIRAVESDVEHLITRIKPVEHDLYKVFYSGHLFQVQFGNEGGDLLLVYGPVTRLSSGKRETIYVALNIEGYGFRQPLNAQPQFAARPQDFWKPPGTPGSARAICMGNRDQYNLLHDPEQTVAWAIVQYLWAAVRLVTGANSLHQQWRAKRQNVGSLRKRSVARKSHRRFS